jgi:hypothetical protein
MATNSTDLQRAPHRATRALVEHDGTATARELYDLFEAFNRRHFSGKLEQALILIETTSRRSLADYCRKDEQGLQSRIRLAPRVAFSTTYGPKLAADALLHEMVHAWLYEVEGDTEDGYRGHGPKFAAKCNEIGALLGLGDVSEKGRRGLPDCAHWPCCVRPPGYYATEWQAPTRRPSAPRPAAEETIGATEIPSDVDEDLDEDLDGEGRAVVADFLTPERTRARFELLCSRLTRAELAELQDVAGIYLEQLDESELSKDGAK